jgi:hypothetical protein
MLMLETWAPICPRTGKIAVFKVFFLLTTPSGYPDAIIEMGYVDAIDSEVKETSNLHKKKWQSPSSRVAKRNSASPKQLRSAEKCSMPLEIPWYNTK